MSFASSTVTVLTGLVNTFKSTIQSNEVPLKTIVAALLLYGVKEFLNDIVFSCPDENFEIYGSLFIFGPSVFLFCLSLLASTPFWQVATGCCLLRCREQKILWSKTKNGVFVAFMPPVIWVIYAFVEEDYYVCAKLGPLNAALARANSSAERNAINQEFSQARTLSELIAWGLLLGLAIFSTLFVTIYRVFMAIDPKLLGKRAYHEYEADKAVMLFNEKIKPLAEQDAEQLVDHLFEKHKEKTHEDQIIHIEEELKKIFPRHAGDLSGPFRVETERPKSDSPISTSSEAPSPPRTKPPPTGDVELRPIMYVTHT
ncbi:cation channel [Porites harrisoni]